MAGVFRDMNSRFDLGKRSDLHYTTIMLGFKDRINSNPDILNASDSHFGILVRNSYTWIPESDVDRNYENAWD